LRYNERGLALFKALKGKFAGRKRVAGTLV